VQTGKIRSFRRYMMAQLAIKPNSSNAVMKISQGMGISRSP
jgi:hypothetical protein